MPGVVALPARAGRTSDESTRRASALAPAAGSGIGEPAPGVAPQAAPEGVPVSGAAARATNVLPLPARPRQRAGLRRDDEPAGTGCGLREAPDNGGPADETDEAFGESPPDRDHEGLDAAELLQGEEGEEDEFDEESGRTGGAAAAQVAAHVAAPGARSLPGTAGAPLADADDQTLAQWIARIARQDERALEALYDATAARVHGLVRRLTQRAALAEEVLEATYWQVWREAPRFDAARGRPLTWLLSMARSRAIDALRREQRFQHEALPEDGEDQAAAWCDAAAPAPLDLLEATRGHAQVHAALASLEPRARQLVALAFFRGLTHEEIAAQQGLLLGTVKSLIRRALQQLRRVMEAEHA
jgi:RNA polymerase sigma-70 factor (ECF subfamily)